MSVLARALAFAQLASWLVVAFMAALVLTAMWVAFGSDACSGLTVGGDPSAGWVARPRDATTSMRKLLLSFVAGVALGLAAWVSSAPSSAESVVAQRLVRYAAFLRRQDSAAVSAMFVPSGIMVHQGQTPVVGRAAIEAFLESFAQYKVLSHDMRVDSAVARGDTVEQTGSYAQAVLTPEGRTLRVAGAFTAVWQQEGGGAWLLRSMRTAPAS